MEKPGKNFDMSETALWPFPFNKRKTAGNTDNPTKLSGFGVSSTIFRVFIIHLFDFYVTLAIKHKNKPQGGRYQK